MDRLLTPAQAKPYYPGFRDLNLFFVAICLIAFLYVILVSAIAYRVRSTLAKLDEVDRVAPGASGESLAKLQADREALQREYERLVATSPGRWFARRDR